jgi:chaperonin GroES
LNMQTLGQPTMGGQAGQATEEQYEVPETPLTPPEPEDPAELEANEEAREQERALNRVNIAEKKDEEELKLISQEVKVGFESDLESMTDWLMANEEWLKLARQVRERKSFPWPDASNIKYPLISTAALQFSARAYPTLVPADGKLVKTRIIGKDPSGEKRKKGERVGTFMSWQLKYDMKCWEEDMDRLLVMVPVVGQVYKKTYYDPKTEKNCSYLVYPENFIVNYWTRDLESAPRYSEVHEMNKNDVTSLMRKGYFRDVELPTPTSQGVHSRQSEDRQEKIKGNVNDFTSTYSIIEQSTWLDLDDDGLREPYIVWFEYLTGEILRIQVRFDQDDILVDEDNEVYGYESKCCYTKFGFIPSPDGSFFDLGFGHLLGPINEAVNSNINQLTDSGTLQNLQGGFIAKGLRLNMADTSWKPGEWKAVNATGDDLRKLIVPLPSKEPSAVLFQLLGMLIQSGKELASVAEIFTGKMPGQNTPATTTMATVEQGMKVFTAIYKRIYRSLESEYKKLFYLNKYYLDINTYNEVLDEPIGPDDFDDKVYDVCPAADPTATTQAEKILKAQALMELLPTGLLDPMKVIQRVLEAQEQPAWEELIPGMAETGQPNPPQEKPDPKAQAQMMKAQTDQQLAAQKAELEERKAKMDIAMKNADLQFKAREHEMDMAHKQQTQQMEAVQTAQMNKIFMAEAQTKAVTSAMEGQQRLKQNDDAHKQKLQQTKENQKLQKTKPAKPAKK